VSAISQVMNSSRVKLLLAIVITAGLVGALWWREHGEAQRLRAELAALKAQASEVEKLRAEIDRLAGENQRLKSEAIDPTELARLRSMGNDLRRLQQEKADLEKKLGAAEAARAKAASAAAAAANANPAAAPQPTTDRPKLASGNAAIAPGQSLVSGGWLMADGRTGLVVLTPKTLTQADGTTVVEIESRIIAASATALERAGLSSLISSSSGLGQAGSSLADSKELMPALRVLNSTGEADFLSAPKIVTGFGGQAKIESGDFSLGVLPTLGQDGRTINVNFDLNGGATAGR